LPSFTKWRALPQDACLPPARTTVSLPARGIAGDGKSRSKDRALRLRTAPARLFH